MFDFSLFGLGVLFITLAFSIALKSKLDFDRAEDTRRFLEDQKAKGKSLRP